MQSIRNDLGKQPLDFAQKVSILHLFDVTDIHAISHGRTSKINVVLRLPFYYMEISVIPPGNLNRHRKHHGICRHSALEVYFTNNSIIVHQHLLNVICIVFTNSFFSSQFSVSQFQKSNKTSTPKSMFSDPEKTHIICIIHD